MYLTKQDPIRMTRLLMLSLFCQFSYSERSLSVNIISKFCKYSGFCKSACIPSEDRTAFPLGSH